MLKFRKANSAVFLIGVDCLCLIVDVMRITDIVAKYSRKSVACNSTKLRDFIEQSYTLNGAAICRNSTNVCRNIQKTINFCYCRCPRINVTFAVEINVEGIPLDIYD